MAQFGEEEPLVASLVDDVSDIYVDIKSGMQQIESGDPEQMEDGIFQIILSRNLHWGLHAVNAIRALQVGLYN